MGVPRLSRLGAGFLAHLHPATVRSAPSNAPPFSGRGRFFRPTPQFPPPPPLFPSPIEALPAQPAPGSTAPRAHLVSDVNRTPDPSLRTPPAMTPPSIPSAPLPQSCYPSLRAPRDLPCGTLFWGHSTMDSLADTPCASQGLQLPALVSLGGP